ncbi:glycoside hydrolase family 13 protein [Lepidopterella palustris CBS 459.81]|uniref:Glycoside hydrolase family 13 protein n=1 Tax=Lepidopterella palustris CBS 459.81 TaxID=1314670 RepID=A0A8E2J9J8_9PEZI|nr:glycoside hydrolase family 13 protein [Lepidopterella palustris CBS 459.81]
MALNFPNPVIFQAFEWDVPADQKHWKRLLAILPILHSIGVTTLWLPPACKASNPSSNGYDIYDLYDLGEFSQKRSISTKWGPKTDLLALAAEAERLEIGLVFDAVLNHRCGGDAKANVMVVEVDKNDRTKNVGAPKEIEAWLKFDFPGRRSKYSSTKLTWHDFNATDWDDRTQRNSIFKLVSGGKDWAQDVDKTEHGNSDYLLLNNLDYTSPALRDDVKKWGVWITEHLNLSGFRLDALQHFSHGFSNEWMRCISSNARRRMLFLGEFWTGNVKLLTDWLDKSFKGLRLYDAPLLYNLARTSWAKDPDLGSVFNYTLVQARPNFAVTLVMNHDTQRGQVMDTPVKPEFMQLAYALILLRRDGIPCIFYGDMFGICGPYSSPPTCWGKLPDLVLARKLYAFGDQVDYFDGRHCVGWVRKGIPEGYARSVGMAVTHVASRLLQKRMFVGREWAGEVWTDLLKRKSVEVVIDREGYGVFPCQRNSVAVYVWKDAEARERFPVNMNVNIYALGR